MWYTAFAVGDRASFSPHLGDLRRVGTRILGWGGALPDKILSNADLEARLDTSDDWIVSRTGIRERRIGDSTSALASAAGGAALRHANVDPASIDLLILCTTTPDQTVPASCARVHHELGLGGGAFDLNGACAGFVNGLITANGLLSAGMGRVLLVAAETLSRITPVLGQAPSWRTLRVRLRRTPTHLGSGSSSRQASQRPCTDCMTFWYSDAGVAIRPGSAR
jgi:hypothetical protein